MGLLTLAVVAMCVCVLPMASAGAAARPSQHKAAHKATHQHAPQRIAEPTRSLTRLALSQAGDPNAVFLTAEAPDSSLNIPVPDGLTALKLTGTVAMNPDSATGTVHFGSGSIGLGSVTVGGSLPPSKPFSLPLAAVAPLTLGSSISLDLTAYLAQSRGGCAGPEAPQLEVTNLVVTYSGQELVPTDVASFLPPILTRLAFWVAAPTSPQQLQAATRVEAGIVARYQAEAPAVTVSFFTPGRLPDLGPFEAFGRNVVIGDTGSGVQVTTSPSGAAVMKLDGDGLQLLDSAAFVTGALAPLDLQPSFLVGGQLVAHRIPPSEQTFGELGFDTFTQSGVGTLAFDLSFDQSQFGGMIDAVTVHTKGVVSPGVYGSSLSALLFFNGDLIADQQLHASGGVFDFNQAVPIGDLQRLNTVSVQVQYQPPTGFCGGTVLPISARLSTGSSIETQAGASLPIGFQRVPQALLPEVELATCELSQEQVSAAMYMVEGLQRLTSVPIIPMVVSIQTALRGKTGALVICTDPREAASLMPTVDLSGPQGVINLSSQPGVVHLGTAPAVAEVFTNHGRLVLLLESRGNQGLVPLAAALGSGPTGLAPYQHDVLVLGPDGAVRDVPVLETLHPSQPGTGVSTPSSPGFPWWTVGSILAVLAVAIAALLSSLLRRRRKTTRQLS